MALLAVDDLSITYRGAGGDVRALDRVSIRLEKRGALGLVGESGCGKSTLATAALQLLPPSARRTGGSIHLDDVDLAALSETQLRRIRWRRMAYVPQSAQNSLVPVHTLRRHFRSTAQAHGMKSRQAEARGAELLKLVELDASVLDTFPHGLSGGMRQRAAIALALLFDPMLLVADEPTTGLDVIVQRQITNLLRNLRAHRDLALLFISHDIGVVAELCESVAVLYAGRIMETGTVAQVLVEPSHPYTIGLQRAFPNIREPDRALTSIGGYPPNLAAPIVGCSFAPRCPFARPVCLAETPPLANVGNDHWAACHFAGEAAEMRRRGADSALWSGAAP